MEIVDGQLHEPGPMQEWDQGDEATVRRLLTELVSATTEAVGVDAVVLHPTEDEGWAEAMAEAHPGRFSSVVSLDDPSAPDLDDKVRGLRDRPGVVGARVVVSFPPSELLRLEAGEFAPIFAACEKHGVPLLVFASGAPEVVAPIARAHPDLQLVVDHLGIRQPPAESAFSKIQGWGIEVPDDPPFRVLPELLALARYPNVAVKLCGAPVLSTEGYPFADVWDPVAQILEAFGVERCFWASDIGRFVGRLGFGMRIPGADADYQGKHTYAESLAFFKENDQLSVTEKEKILGGTVRKLLRWPAPA